MDNKIITPCTGICKLQNDRCLGCQRTLQQISNWTKYTDKQRQHIINENSRYKQSIP